MAPRARGAESVARIRAQLIPYKRRLAKRGCFSPRRLVALWFETRLTGREMRQMLPASVGRRKDGDILVPRCLRALVVVPSRQAKGMYHGFMCRDKLTANSVKKKDAQDCVLAACDAWDNGAVVECWLKAGLVRCVTVPGHTTAVACRCQTIGWGQRKCVLRRLLAAQRNAAGAGHEGGAGPGAQAATHRHWLLCCASIRSSDAAGEGSDCYPALPTVPLFPGPGAACGVLSQPLCRRATGLSGFISNIRRICDRSGLDEGGGIKRIARAIACLLGGRAAAGHRIRQVLVAECGGGVVEWGHVKAALQRGS